MLILFLDEGVGSDERISERRVVKFVGEKVREGRQIVMGRLLNERYPS